MKSFKLSDGPGWAAEMSYKEAYLIMDRSPRLILCHYNDLRQGLPKAVSAGYPNHIVVTGKKNSIRFVKKIVASTKLQASHYLGAKSINRQQGAFMVYIPDSEAFYNYGVPHAALNYEVWMQDNSVMETPLYEVRQYI